MAEAWVTAGKIPSWAEQIEFEWTDVMSGIARVTSMDEKKKIEFEDFVMIGYLKQWFGYYGLRMG